MISIRFLRLSALTTRLCMVAALAAASPLLARAQVSPWLPYVVPQTPDPLFSNLTIPASAPVQGMWSTTQSWPLVGLHVTVMPDGRVISYGTADGFDAVSGIQDGRTLDLWDPKQGFVPASHLTISDGQLVDSFCSSATILPSGKILVSGGASANDGYTAFGSTLVTPTTSSSVRSVSNLAAQRWYSTMISLPDGRAVITGGGTPYAIVSGYADPTDTAPNISETPEIYSPTTGWSSLIGATSSNAFGPVNNRAWYPRQWVAPDGTVFGISTDVMWNLYATGSGSIRMLGNFKTTVNNTTLPNVGPTSTAVMYDTGKILQVGGNGYNNGYPSPSSPYATMVDITNVSFPLLKDTTPMTYPRQWANSTVLPNGVVAVTGGTTFGDSAGSNAVYPAELWNPNTGTWTIGASAANYRGYHSAAALLPDGVILSTGGGVPGPVNNLNAEIYYPPYLFTSVNNTAVLAQRPHMVSLTSNTTNYGSLLQAQMADSNPVAEISLIGLSSVTHSFNTGQRRQKLAFTQNGSMLTITMPPSPNLDPPGYYQISALNTNRVPSPGVILALNAAAPPASSATALLPVNNVAYSLFLVSAPTNVIRQQNYMGVVSPLTYADTVLNRLDAQFYITPGLANGLCYSFMSKKFAGYYLRSVNQRILLNVLDQTSQMASDSTFCAVAGLAGSGFSLQALSNPNQYLAADAGFLYTLANDGSNALAQAATWNLQELDLPSADNQPHAFGNIAQPGNIVRQRNFMGYLAPVNAASTAVDIGDSTFYIRPGMANAACYSFESQDNPGYFLRVLSNLAIGLNTNDGSASFASDSTFCLTTGLAGGVGFSLTSYTYPSDYLRQISLQLFVAPNDSSANFPSDATFTLNPTP